MSVAGDAALVVASFFIGAMPFGLIVSTLFFRRDIRAEGSGNIGAANALRTLGKGPAVVVLLLDALKGALPVLAGRDFDGNTLACIAGFAAVTGHCYSPFLGFRGGKGVATFLGTVIALAWPAAIFFAVVWVGVVGATGYSSAGSLLATLCMIPALAGAAAPAGGYYGIAAVLLIGHMHRGNIARLRAGTENKLRLFQRVKGRPPG